MICPHCKKAIPHKVNDKAIIRAKELSIEGFSLREIEKILFAEGMSVSIATLSRNLKKVKL